MYRGGVAKSTINGFFYSGFNISESRGNSTCHTLPHYLITKPRRFSYIIDHTGGVLPANCKNVEAKLLPVGVDVVNRVWFPQDAVDNYWLRRFHLATTKDH